MGVDPDDFVTRHPRLFHMAEVDSWSSIQEHGLLSTTALLDLYEVTGKQRAQIERAKRTASVTISHIRHGTAVIRDQKPLIEKVLDRTLEGATIPEFCALLNARVFFWVSRERLDRLRTAGPYRNRQHLILTIDTAEMVRRHRGRITLSHLNSGATHPGANYPRGPATFQRLDSYPWEQRMLTHRAEPVVEMAVDYAVPDVASMVITHEVR